MDNLYYYKEKRTSDIPCDTWKREQLDSKYKDFESIRKDISEIIENLGGELAKTSQFHLIW
jgi:hypothetical protein